MQWSSPRRGVGGVVRTNFTLPARWLRTFQWKHAAILLFAIALILLTLLIQQQPRELFPEERFPGGGGRLGSQETPTRPTDSLAQSNAISAATQQLENERAKVRQLEAALESVTKESRLAAAAASGKTAVLPSPSDLSTTPKVLVVNRTVIEYVNLPPIPPERNPLHLPPHLNTKCNDPDVIVLQRWIQQRQHTYVETLEELNPNAGTSTSSSTKNPDPDPYCERTKLFIDTVPNYYQWTEVDLMKQEEQERSEKSGNVNGMGSQRVIYPEFSAQIPQGRRPRRQTGFGLGAQLHITASRMIHAWKMGYTYVNLARSSWTKGILPKEEEDSDAIPYKSDSTYWTNAPWIQQKDSSAATSEWKYYTCQKGGWDCFFLPHTSLACRRRAEKFLELTRHFPPLNEQNRQKIAELEAQWSVKLDMNLDEQLKTQTTLTSKERVFALKNLSKGKSSALAVSDPKFWLGHSEASKLEKLPTSFDLDKDASDGVMDWMAHSSNPWMLPGLSLTQGEYSSGGAGARGDLFLISEVLRFFMRPNKWMRGRLHSLLSEIKFPGVPLLNSNGEEDGSIPQETLSSRSVISVHVRRNVDQKSQNLIAIHKSEEYMVLVRRLTPVLGVSGVFISSDDKSRIELFEHTLGPGLTEKDPGLGMDVFFVPYKYLSEPQAPIKPVPHGKSAAALRAAGANAADQAHAIIAGLLPEEGAMHVASLYIMSLFSSAFVGTISSHWGRVVMELQRWNEGSCAPAKQGWLLPKSKKLDTSQADSENKPTFNPLFVDMDGDTYFIGDFKMVKHTHIPAPNSPNLDPSIDE